MPRPQHTKTTFGVASIFLPIETAAIVTRILSVPICMTLLAAVVIGLPGQTHEYYRVLFENMLMGSRHHYMEAGIGLASAIAMCSAIAFAARVLAIDYGENRPQLSPGTSNALAWTPIALGTIPLFALAWGLYSAADIGGDIDRSAIEKELRAFGDASFTAPILSLFEWVGNYQPTMRQASLGVAMLAVIFAGFAWLIATRTGAGHGFYAFSCGPASAITSAIIIGGVIACAVRWPVSFPEHVGVLGLFSIFVVLVTLVASQMRIWGRITRIPIIGILLIAAVLFSALDINDNHELRRIDKEGRPVLQTEAAKDPGSTLPDVEQSFLDWYRSRPDRGHFERQHKKYPVFIVAAQGGGIYAAAQSLLFLTKLQATCDRFNQHLFAISAVSGGAVGSAFYSGLVSEFTPSDAQCEPWETHSRTMAPPLRATYLASTELMRRDYLSPLVASALFPDFVQRFLPLTRKEWSRERALEKALEENWANVRKLPAAAKPGNANQMQAGVLHSWNSTGTRPAVLYNTTETGSGRRRVIAPFRFGEVGGNDLRFLPLEPGYDVPVSAAAIASARFPWLTPAAWFWEFEQRLRPRKIRLVDGGYFENSGVSTAMDLVGALERVVSINKLPVEIHLIVTTSGGFATQTFFGFGELFAPIQSLLNARQARNYAMIDLSDRQLGPISSRTSENGGSPLLVRRLQRVELKNFVTPLPLGWRLSMAAVFQIDRMTGLIGHCVPNERFEQIARMKAFTSADCVKQVVHHLLRGDDLASSLDAARARTKELR